MCDLVPAQRMWRADRFERRRRCIEEISRVFRYRKPPTVVSAASVLQGIQVRRVSG